MSIDPLDSESDPFRPPKVPTTVGCLHCGAEYDSSLIEWRVKTKPDGSQHGFWCCPMPGCDGIGFGFDLLPTDPTYQDEHGGWIQDADESEISDVEANGFADDHTPPSTEAGDEDIPW